MKKIEMKKIEEKISTLPFDKVRRIQEVLSSLPESSADKLVSIIEDISPDVLVILVEIFSGMKIQDVQEFIDELSLLPGTGAKEIYIKQRFEAIQKLSDISPLERFYSGSDMIPEERILGQVGYNISWGTGAYPSSQFISSGYILGPGDSLFVYIWGKILIPTKDISFPIAVTVLHDGRIFIPIVGPVSVAGLSIESASETIRGAIRRVLGDVEVAVSLANLRAIPVVVMGEVKNPGVHILSGTISPFDAVAQAGGIKKTGSLRKISVIRQGEKVVDVDLYDLIVYGRGVEIVGDRSKSSDRTGGDRTGGDGTGAVSKVGLEVVGKDERGGEGFQLRAWDIVFVPKIGPTFGIKGSVKAEGIYEIKGNGIPLSEAIYLAGGVIPQNGKFRITVKRYYGDARKVAFDIIVDLREEKIPDFLIVDGDMVEVVRAISDIIQEYIMISGYVKRTVRIPFFTGMTLKDAISFAGGFKDVIPPYAYEIIRNGWDGEKEGGSKGNEGKGNEGKGNGGKGNENKIFFIVPDEKRGNIEDVLRFFSEVKLVPYDRITIFPPPDEELPKFISVEVLGEVRFPGEYLIRRGERLSDLLIKAGGFTDDAYPDAVIFTRQSAAVAQSERLEFVRQLLIKELLGEGVYYYKALPQFGFAEQTSGFMGEEKLKILNYLLGPHKVQGRMVIRIPKDLNRLKGSQYDIELESGDRIIIPRRPDFVIVAGEVRNPGTLVYVEGKKASFFVKSAGGLSKYADSSNIYIIRANGETTDDLDDVRPGDTIVVPPKVRVPYQTWYIVRDALSVLFQGVSATALMYNALR